MDDSEGMLGLYRNAFNDIPFIDETNQHQANPTRDDRVNTNDENLASENRDEERPLENVLLPSINREITDIIYFQIRLKSGLTIRFPSTAGSYQTIGFIGTGAFSAVAKLQMMDKNNLFAGKIYPIQDMKKNGTYEIITQEYKFLSSNQHENIIKMYDCFIQKDDQDKAYLVIVLDYCSNGDLTVVLNERKFEPQELKNHIICIVDALSYIHSNGIAHCDIKPDNILINSEGKAMLADFGFMTNEELTVSQKCTPEYAAPELLGSNIKPYDPKKSDIWALGITFYSMSTRYQFFIKNEPRTQKRIDSKLKSIEDPKLRDLIQNMLTMDPNSRFTIDDVKNHEYLLH